jgi:hypothetical protein
MTSSKYYPGNWHEELEKTTKNLRSAGGPAEIGTEYLPNTHEEPYRWTNLLGSYALIYAFICLCLVTGPVTLILQFSFYCGKRGGLYYRLVGRINEGECRGSDTCKDTAHLLDRRTRAGR